MHAIRELSDKVTLKELSILTNINFIIINYENDSQVPSGYKNPLHSELRHLMWGRAIGLEKKRG